jgi:hypothetical protein
MRNKIIDFDYASLYPSSMNMNLVKSLGRKLLRKLKIIKIFNDRYKQEN